MCKAVTLFQKKYFYALINVRLMLNMLGKYQGFYVCVCVLFNKIHHFIQNIDRLSSMKTRKLSTF